ncbi:MAG: hypothetical protein U0R52_12120 [Solirubrobacterales bacterium]
MIERGSLARRLAASLCLAVGAAALGFALLAPGASAGHRHKHGVVKPVKDGRYGGRCSKKDENSCFDIWLGDLPGTPLYFQFKHDYCSEMTAPDVHYAAWSFTPTLAVKNGRFDRKYTYNGTLPEYNSYPEHHLIKFHIFGKFKTRKTMVVTITAHVADDNNPAKPCKGVRVNERHTLKLLRF